MCGIGKQLTKKPDLALQYERMLHEQFAMQVSFGMIGQLFELELGVCQNVDNAVVSFVGVRFARPEKRFALCLRAGTPMPLQLKLDRPV